ncbi:hypothetical protein EV2_008641 [Malus domestica]
MAGLHLPDLVTHKIIQILPTKAAVRMSFISKQWAGFFKEFGRSKNLDLIVAAFKNVIFPTEFRSASSCAILPGLNNNLALKVSNYLETD